MFKQSIYLFYEIQHKVGLVSQWFILAQYKFSIFLLEYNNNLTIYRELLGTISFEICSYLQYISYILNLDSLCGVIDQSRYTISYVLDKSFIWQLFDDVFDNGVNISTVVFLGSHEYAYILLSEVGDIFHMYPPPPPTKITKYVGQLSFTPPPPPPML